MKLSSLTVLFSLIVATIFLGTEFKMRELKRNEYLEIYNRKILEHASGDACTSLKSSAEIYGGSIATSSEIDANLVFDTFFKSMNLSLGIHSDAAKEDIKKYFPLLCVIENDGVTLSSYIEVNSADGVFAKRVVLPKYRFYLEHHGILYYPTLSGEVTVVYSEDGLLKEESGTPERLLQRPGRTIEPEFLKEPNVNALMQAVIREQISQLISEEIERHEREMAKLGLRYDFFLPEGYDSALEVNSPCFIALMQGYPLYGSGKACNTMNLTKFDIDLQGFYGGFVEDGVKYYLPLSDPKASGKSLTEAFTDEFSALRSGYYKYAR